MMPITISDLKKIDNENMFVKIANFYQQLESSLEFYDKINIPFETNHIRNIVFSGMGGSAIGGLLLKDYVSNKLDIPFIICRNYDIPKFVGENTLFFASSYSGNTEESLSAYEKAKQNGAKIISITSGGKLKEISKKDDTFNIILPSDVSPPRCALGYSFTIPLLILIKSGLIDNKFKEIEETITNLKEQSKQFSELSYPDSNTPLILANKLLDKLPIIYSVEQFFGAVSYRWKCQFSENSKTMAFNNYFTELNHNEIMGWEWKKFRKSNPMVIVLNDKEIEKKVSKTIDITIEMLNNENIPVEQIWSEGKSLLARIFSLLYIGDFTSYYLAIIKKIDPTPIKKIETLKEKLQKR
jgi:glucose/mannose-6-phosphate isomerase